MATLNLTITYPDGEQARILTALKAHFATNGNPSPSNAQVIEALRLTVTERIKSIVQEQEAKAAAAAIVPPGVS